MLTPFSADAKDENVQNFVTKYKAKYNATPDQFAADGYDAIYAIAAALKEADIKGDTVADLDIADFNSKMVAAMTKITVDGVTGQMTWGADGETSKGALAMIIKDGVTVLYEKE